jgi:hypothetical protein
MSRPTGVTVSALLMLLFIVAGLILTYTHAVSTNGTIPISPSISTATSHAFIWGASAVSAIIVYFYWSAHNWARILVLIQSVLCLVPFHKQPHHQWVLVRLSVFTVGDALLAIYLLWYLNTRAIRIWFAGQPDATDTPAQHALRAATHFLLKSPFKRI